MLNRNYFFFSFLLFLVTVSLSAQKKTDSLNNHLEKLVNGINGPWNEQEIEHYIVEHHLKEAVLSSIPWLEEKINTDNNKHLLFLGTAYLFFDVSEFKSAQELSMAALKAAEHSGSKEREAAACNVIGNVFSELRVPEQSFAYFRKGITALKATGKDTQIGSLYNNFANAFYRQAEFNTSYFDSCKKYNRMALELGIKYGNVEMQLNAYQSLALAATDLKHYKEAEEMFRKNIALSITLEDDISLYTTYYQLGRLFASTEEFSQADSAIKYLAIASDYARKFKSASMISELFYQLSKAYYNKKEYKKSADYSIRFSEYNDSLNVIQNAKDIGELSQKYESAKKEAMIKELNLVQTQKQEQINRQFYMIAGAVIVLIFVIIVSLVLYRTNKLRKKANEELTEKNVLIEHQKLKVVEQSDLINEKNKEIIDSIRYAQRIQNALLPSEKLIKRFIHKK